MTEFYSHLEVIGRHYNYQPHRWHNGMVSVLASSAVDRGFEPRVSDWLFNANSAIFQLYHEKNKLIFNEMMMRSALY
jgi:hypothetical protein